MNMKMLMMAAATTALMGVSTVAFGAVVTKPATAWTGQGAFVTSPSDYDDSGAQAKDQFGVPPNQIGSLGDQQVVDAMNDDSWFGTIAGFNLSVSDLVASSGDCGTGNVTCNKSASWTGNAGETANLFVIHTGKGNDGNNQDDIDHAVDTIFAFFFYDAISSFSLTNLYGGGSFLRAYTVDCDECGGNSNNPVPIPGALPLLATGLAGLGYMARRRRKA